MKPNVHLETEAFKKAVDKMRDHHEIVVETGTNDGTGSTKIFADAGYRVHSCEMDTKLWWKAGENLSRDNVHLYNAITLRYEDLHVESYMSMQKKPRLKENWLIEKIEEFSSYALYFLDSHWTHGFAEFNKILEHHYLFGHLMHVILDDVTNLKHRPSLHFLKTQYSKPFKIDHPSGERFATVTLLPHETDVS